MAAIDGGGQLGKRVRIAGWGAAGCLLLLPWVAMHFTEEVDWGPEDFVFAAVLIVGVGVALELAVRLSRNLAYRAGAAAALAAVFLMTWANAAVGIIGAVNNPINAIFPAIVLVALLGSVIARFRARGMAIAMAVAGGAQLVAVAIGLTQDVRGALLSGIFVLLWATSAALFATAARERT